MDDSLEYISIVFSWFFINLVPTFTEESANVTKQANEHLKYSQLTHILYSNL